MLLSVRLVVDYWITAEYSTMVDERTLSALEEWVRSWSWLVRKDGGWGGVGGSRVGNPEAGLRGLLLGTLPMVAAVVVEMGRLGSGLLFV